MYIKVIQDLANVTATVQPNLEPGDIHTCLNAGSLGPDLHPT